MKIMKNINKDQKGIGLVEVIAALGLAVIVLTALISLSLFTIRSSLQSKLMLEGTKLANKELELVRALRDSSENWYDNDSSDGTDGFLNDLISNGCDSGCYMNNLNVVSGAFTAGSGPEAITKTFRATKTDGTALTATDEVVRISVDISWNIASEVKHARLYTDLTNWANK